MSETIDLPSSLTGFQFVFSDDDQHQQRFVELSYGGQFVALISAENYPTSFDVEWPSARPHCAKIDYDKLMEALAFGQRMLALRLVGTAMAS